MIRGRLSILLGVFLLLISGCSWPRILILKDPLTPEEHLNLGVTYEKQGEYDAAIKEYRVAARKLPLASHYLGNVYFQRNEWRKAEEAYREALEKAPDNADTCNNLAWLYYTQRKNLDQAEALARKALELNPAKGEIYRDTLNKIREVRKDF